MCAAPTIRGSGFPTASNPARPAWLRALASWTRAHGTLLVADDIQMGCGRTGRLLSFETAGIIPDLICLSKSISGYGTPMALTLMRPEYDQWRPGEHNGTFRGYDPAFNTAARALEMHWSDGALAARTAALGERTGCAVRVGGAWRGAFRWTVRAPPARCATPPSGRDSYWRPPARRTRWQNCCPRSPWR
ncbi:aminotransferase class III-fold pyridoxal phosphate-dependent enzyme [Streptomyces griseoluteus]|uniref:aminotransferase class III-fold pyridoxal phosphate-dependent enzyme n=1 Tax=Streptomyces griseoluteus TaxID=29306 RepID=UPI00381DE211